MIDLVTTYWPFMASVLALGFAVGWWSEDPRSVDDLTAWLERGSDEP